MSNQITNLGSGGWAVNVLVAAVTLAVGVALTSRRMRRSELWQAAVTPLASIIGSGFLVVAPLLAFAVGDYAAVAMAGLVLVAYLVGGAVRYNIRHVEELVEESDAAPDPLLSWLERAAKVALAAAYVIAIAFYVELLGAFILRAFPAEGPLYQKGIATGILAGIGTVGRLRGLRMLERLERVSVDIKLGIIGGFLAGLVFHNGELLLSGSWELPAVPASWDPRTIRTLLGALLIVQGFETSRYLRGAYSEEVRVRTMRIAQWVSAGIYVAFVAASTVLFDVFKTISETGIIDLSERIAGLLPLLLILGAVMSQFSAAVADTLGAGGLVEEATGGKLSERNTYVIAAGLAIVLIWVTDIFSVIAWASRAFAAYYAVQTTMSTIHAWRAKPHGGSRRARALLHGALSLLMIAAAIFGIPAESAGGAT